MVAGLGDNGPPQEWPTRRTGPSCMPITRWAAVTSSPSELRGFWTAIAFSPRLVSKGMTFAQQEPSANAPCTRTIVLIAMTLLLELTFDRKLPTGCVWWSSSQDYLLFLKYAVGGLTALPQSAPVDFYGFAGSTPLTRSAC